jgi:hypothetical protein
LSWHKPLVVGRDVTDDHGASRAARQYFGVPTESTQPGVHSELITEALDAQLSQVGSERRAERSIVRNAEAPDRLSRHIAAIAATVVSALAEQDRAELGAELVNQLIARLDELEPSVGVLEDKLVTPPQALDAITLRRPDGTFAPVELPLTPLLDTTVLTNAPGEPTIQHELIAEIPSADRIDIHMAFVRWSGVRPLMPALRLFRDGGRTVRLVTTTYTNSTEAAALHALSDIGIDIKVLYDVSTTRLHRSRGSFIAIEDRPPHTSGHRTSRTARWSLGWSGTSECRACATPTWWRRWPPSSTRTGRART